MTEETQLEALAAAADDGVEDDAETDESTPLVQYDVTSYGSDPDVEGLVRRMTRGEILLPSFQREYVWNVSEASKFVESLLLGLPVPGVFLAKESDSNRLLVIDGQQRLKTLRFFYEGYFNPKPDERRRRVFSLSNVQEGFEGRTYSTLDERDRLRLDNSVIHATIVKQDRPPSDDTSIYHIFARLNSGGRRLTPQEIRAALYHGRLLEEIRGLNDYENWRRVFGRPSSRLKDQELILRFLAFYEMSNEYSRPMAEFLNLFAARFKETDDQTRERMGSRFRSCIDLFSAALGTDAFRPVRALNTAVFDSCMVGLARRLDQDGRPTEESVRNVYSSLLANAQYSEAVSRSTADEAFVSRRLNLATEAFAQA